MSKTKQMTQTAGIVGFAALLSRILGFVRDMVIAGFFGAGADAFFVAFRIPNLMRRLFAEGTLTMSFVPVFIHYSEKSEKKDAMKMACSAFRSWSLILLIGVGLGICFSPLLIRIIAPGFSSSQFSLTVTLTRAMFPYVGLICLTALCMGVLNALGHFTGPALAPLFLNLSMICAMIWVCPYMENPALALAFSVVIGGLFQLGIQIPCLIQKNVYFWKSAPLFHPGVMQAGRRMLPAVLGAAAYQINILVGTLLASFLAKGSVSYLYYADRLVQFPLGIFAAAIGTAILPTLSRQAALNDQKGIQETFVYGLRLVFFITLPAMTGLIVLRQPIISLLFQRGAFDIQTAQHTADALLYYGAGLWAFAGIRVAASVFYAIHNTKTPLKIAVISIFVNAACGVMLMKEMNHNGIALAASLASGFNLMTLLYVLKRRFKGNWGIFKSACKSLICSLIMGSFVWYLSCFMISGVGLFITIAFGIVSYGALSFLIKSPELYFLLNVFIRK